MELAEPAATEISSSSEQHKKKQMKLNDEIRLYMANAFTADHEDEKKLQNALKEPRKRGRGDAIKILAQQLLDSKITARGQSKQISNTV